MIELEVPIKKKDQMRIDEEYARKLEAEEQEAARLNIAQQDEEANKSWDSIQAMIDANRLLAKRLQAREREEFSNGRSFDEIKKLFDREMRKVNDFIAMDSEAQKSSAKEAQESITKRTTLHLESNISKKQKVDKNVEPVIDDSEELKKCMEIVPDVRDEVLIEATPLSSKSPTIIDYKIHKEGKKTYFKIPYSLYHSYKASILVPLDLSKDTKQYTRLRSPRSIQLGSTLTMQLANPITSDTYKL
nr:hypothetical protein [Tanacetum cinerariifolium]